MSDTDDVVIEFKVRLAGLTYDQAGRVRDLLRTPGYEGLLGMVEEVVLTAKDAAPLAEVTAHSPWCEWRPARGRRQSRVYTK